MRCSVETLRTIKKQFFRKHYSRTENCEFSNYNFGNFMWFYDSIVKKLLFWTLDFERKKVRRFFLCHWSTKKNYKFSKNIEKTPYRRVSQKKVQFCTMRRKSHFNLTLPVHQIKAFLYRNWYTYFLSLILKPFISQTLTIWSSRNKMSLRS